MGKMQDQKLSLYCLQRTIRNYHIGKTWNWWKLWLAIKPNLKCTKFAQFKAEYEEKIAIAEANIDKAVEECNKVIAVHDTLMAQKMNMLWLYKVEDQPYKTSLIKLIASKQ